MSTAKQEDLFAYGVMLLILAGLAYVAIMA
jgi:hypothetical protein